MRKRTGIFALVGVIAALTAGGLPASAGEPSGIQGEVLDVTCYGPCMDPPPPPRYWTGEGLRVTVRRVVTGRLVRVVEPDDGRFRVRVRRGLYRVRARVPGDRCIEGDAETVRVRRHEFAKVTLEVANSCIL